MTTMTDSEALAVLDEISEYLAERADVKDGDYGQPEPNHEMTLHVELRQARAHIAEALMDAEIGRKWREDSSLETWFPFTAEELVRLREEVATLRADSSPKYTTGHCEHKNRPGGCQQHNLQCGYPKCDRRVKS